MNLSCKSSSPGLAPVAKRHGCCFLRVSRHVERWVRPLGSHSAHDLGTHPPVQPQAPPCKVKGSLGTEPPGPLQVSVSEFRVDSGQAGAALRRLRGDAPRASPTFTGTSGLWCGQQCLSERLHWSAGTGSPNTGEAPRPGKKADSVRELSCRVAGPGCPPWPGSVSSTVAPASPGAA